MDMEMKDYKEFIDNEMMVTMAQMDKPSKILDYLYLVREYILCLIHTFTHSHPPHPHTHTHTHIHSHIQTHIHTHIHTHTPSLSFLSVSLRARKETLRTTFHLFLTQVSNEGLCVALSHVKHLGRGDLLMSGWETALLILLLLLPLL